MATATATSRRAAPAPRVLKARRDLAEERVTIERKLGPQYARMATLDTELKALATAAGESFVEAFPGVGQVNVAGAVAAEFKGEVPQIVTEAWLKLSDAKRKQLVDQGLVAIEKQYGRASSGRVTVKVF